MCGHVHMCACVHPPAHAHAHTCACRRACTHAAHTNARAGECAHMHAACTLRAESAHTGVCTRRVHEIHAPEGCTKKHARTRRVPRPKQSEVTKNITARSHLRTHVIVSKSCERRVRHACAYNMCTEGAHVYTCTQRVHVSAPKVRFTSRGAKRRVRPEKEKKPSHGDAPKVRPYNTCTRRVHVTAPEGCGLTSRGAKRTVRYEKEKAMREDAPSVHPFKPHFVRSLARSASLRFATLRSPAAGSLRDEKKKRCTWRSTTCHLPTPATNRAMTPTPYPLPHRHLCAHEASGACAGLLT